MTQNKTEMSTQSETPPAMPEIVTPASARALFWRPRFLRASPDLCHLPFLFWLTDLAQPRIVASLGLGDGVAYFAICQAMERRGQESLCHGISAVPITPELTDHNDREYDDISRLSPGTARVLAGQMADGTVDLLAVHGVPDLETVAALSDEWPRKMSARGVIVLHDVAHWPEDGPARLYLDRLGRDHPVISFDEGDGLVVALRGADQPGQLSELARLDPMASGAGEVRRVFRRLGLAVQTEWAARDSAERAEAAQARAAAAEAALTKLEAAQDSTSRSLAELRDMHEVRTREVAVLQAKLDSAEALRDATGLSDLMRRHGAAQQELGALRARLTEAEARAADGRRIAAEARAAVETAERARLEAEKMATDRVVAKDRALQQLNVQLSAAREAYDEAERARLEAEKMATDRVVAKDQALQELDAQLSAACKDREAIGRDLQALEEELSGLKAASEHRMRGDLLTLTRQLEASREDRDAVNHDLQALKIEIARLSAERDDTRRHVEALLSSTSWKLTSPLRRLIDGMRRLRGGAG